MAVGGTSTTVEVTNAAPVVDLSTSSTGEVIAGRQVTELPLNGRNFTQLALLTPGVTRGDYGNSASGSKGDAETFRNSTNGGGSLSNNGLRPQANNFILDGVDNNESLVNTLEFFPNVEATQEFRVNTSVASAEGPPHARRISRALSARVSARLASAIRSKLCSCVARATNS